MSSLDVLLVTALPMEFEAARQVATSTGHGAPGIMSWEENDRGTATPYMVGDYITYDGASMKVGLARPTRMGGKSTAFLATSLVGRLHPRCLAMCGVCAGNPADLALGDVIIAEMTYSYDEGKRSPGKFEGDHRQTPLHDDAWLRAFQELRPDGLPSYGVASERDADLWLLERLYYGVSPQHHPARDRYFPQGKWRKRVHELEADGRIFRIASKLQLTEKGRDFVDSSLVYDVDPPIQLPFAIKVGPIASGNAVVKDGVTWDVLKGLGVRSVLGLEMEAATIGDAARLNSTPWVVVKGVMDHADPAKDDRYKPFAARASAEVLFKFLVSQDAKLVSVPDLKPSSPSTGPSTVDGHATKAERDYVCSRAFVSIIQALFDAQYYIPDINTEIELYRASMFIPDALLAEIRPNMRQNAPLEEVARQLVTNGLIDEALSYLVKKVRDDWDKLRPYAKLSILKLSERYPTVGLSNLPPLRQEELEVASIRWFIADALFQEEWDGWIARMSARGLDLKKKTIEWGRLTNNIEYYCEEFVFLMKTRVEIDIALIQASIYPNRVRDLRGYVVERSHDTYYKIVAALKEICDTEPKAHLAFNDLAVPMQQSVEDLFNNPLAVIPPLKWRMELEKYLK